MTFVRGRTYSLDDFIYKFKQLGYAPSNTVMRRSYPWGPIDGQEEYIFWTPSPTIIQFSQNNVIKNQKLVRLEYNDDSPINTAELITQPENNDHNTISDGQLNTAYGPVTIYSNDPSSRYYTPNTNINILKLNGMNYNLWDIVRNNQKKKNITDYLSERAAVTSGRPGTGRVYQEVMREILQEQGFSKDKIELELARLVRTDAMKGSIVETIRENTGSGRKKI